MRIVEHWFAQEMEYHSGYRECAGEPNTTSNITAAKSHCYKPSLKSHHRISLKVFKDLKVFISKANQKCCDSAIKLWTMHIFCHALVFFQANDCFFFCIFSSAHVARFWFNDMTCDHTSIPQYYVHAFQAASRYGTVIPSLLFLKKYVSFFVVFFYLLLTILILARLNTKCQFRYWLSFVQRSATTRCACSWPCWEWLP